MTENERDGISEILAMVAKRPSTTEVVDALPAVTGKSASSHRAWVARTLRDLETRRVIRRQRCECDSRTVRWVMVEHEIEVEDITTEVDRHEDQIVYVVTVKRPPKWSSVAIPGGLPIATKGDE